jgi:uncharacterized protein YjbJ (UPF0337 family)
MNNNQFKGSWRQLKGELKKDWDQFSDDDLLQPVGEYDKFPRAIQKRYDEQKHEVERWVENWCERGGWRKQSTGTRDQKKRLRLRPIRRRYHRRSLTAGATSTHDSCTSRYESEALIFALAP